MCSSCSLVVRIVMPMVDYLRWDIDIVHMFRWRMMEMPKIVALLKNQVHQLSSLRLVDPRLICWFVLLLIILVSSFSWKFYLCGLFFVSSLLPFLFDSIKTINSKLSSFLCCCWGSIPLWSLCFWFYSTPLENKNCILKDVYFLVGSIPLWSLCFWLS